MFPEGFSKNYHEVDLHDFSGSEIEGPGGSIVSSLKESRHVAVETLNVLLKHAVSPCFCSYKRSSLYVFSTVHIPRGHIH
jgi:hypothetical protein